MSLYYGNPIVGGDRAGKGEIVPGHEPAGDVVELGAGVSNIAVGDRVAVYLAIGCGHCRHCLSGHRMLCAEWKCLGFDVDGGDADYLIVPGVNCLRLPETISYDAGALLTDMIGTQYHAQKRLGISGATSLAVFGVGPMGGASILVGRARGARVIAVDVLADRLELARELGAHAVVNSATDDPVERLRELTAGEGVDAAIDCSGSPAAQNAALDAVRKRGAVAFVGESRETTINPSDQLLRKMLTVIGAWYFPLWEYGEIVSFVIERQIPVERLITHRFPLSEAEQAFRLFDERRTEKAIFTWDGDA